MFFQTNAPFDECSVRPMFRSTNVPCDQCSFDESAFDESVFDESAVSLQRMWRDKYPIEEYLINIHLTIGFDPQWKKIHTTVIQWCIRLRKKATGLFVHENKIKQPKLTKISSGGLTKKYRGWKALPKLSAFRQHSNFVKFPAVLHHNFRLKWKFQNLMVPSERSSSDLSEYTLFKIVKINILSIKINCVWKMKNFRI